MPQYNRTIIELFQLLIKQMKAEYLNAQLDNDQKESTTHKFRIQSTVQALNTIKKLNFEITQASDLHGISGIGKGTITRIQEILDTGTLTELKNKYNKTKQAQIDNIQELEQIIGIGNKTAKKLIEEKKIRSIGELKKAIKTGKIEVSHQIMLGLKYYGIVQREIPRREIKSIEKYLKKTAQILDNPSDPRQSQLQVMICGSYRRGKKFAGDIDVLLFHPEMTKESHVKNPTKYGFESYLELLVDTTTEDGFLIDHLTDKGYKTKYMGFCRYKNNPVRRIDIRFVAYNSRYTAMLYYTGPYELNTVMRTMAKKQKMHLNEYGLYRVSEDGTMVPVKIKSEEDVFRFIGMKYLTPEEREGYSAGKNK